MSGDQLLGTLGDFPSRGGCHWGAEGGRWAQVSRVRNPPPGCVPNATGRYGGSGARTKHALTFGAFDPDLHPGWLWKDHSGRLLICGRE
jgi:hypothetical protein